MIKEIYEKKFMGLGKRFLLNAEQEKFLKALINFIFYVAKI